MSLIEWNDSLRLGIASIDYQHERLVVLINSLHDAMIARHGNDALGVILEELVKYTDEHFSYEELLFKTHGYRAASEHIALHRELVQQVCDFRDKFKSGRLGMSASVLGFLTQWLTQHICTEDEKYVRFLMAKGVR